MRKRQKELCKEKLRKKETKKNKKTYIARSLEKKICIDLPKYSAKRNNIKVATYEPVNWESELSEGENVEATELNPTLKRRKFATIWVLRTLLSLLW